MFGRNMRQTDRQDIIIHNMIAFVCRKDWSRKIAVNILSRQ